MNKFEDARSTGQKEENIMGKYEQDARLLLEYVGGKENIAAVSHCVSRMRFVLNDPAKADVAKIEALKSAKGTFTQAGQFQVIIGNTVSDFYNDFIAVSGIDGVSKDAVKSAAKQNQNALQKVMSALAEIFAPLIPAIITGGLILGFRNCIDSIYFFNNGTQTLCDISQFWSGVDSFLWLIGEAIFHMLPVCICWSVTKKMGTTQSLGIVLGLTLVSGQLLNAYAVASTAAADSGYFLREFLLPDARHHHGGNQCRSRVRSKVSGGDSGHAKEEVQAIEQRQQKQALPQQRKNNSRHCLVDRLQKIGGQIGQTNDRAAQHEPDNQFFTKHGDGSLLDEHTDQRLSPQQARHTGGYADSHCKQPDVFEQLPQAALIPCPVAVRQ